MRGLDVVGVIAVVLVVLVVLEERSVVSGVRDLVRFVFWRVLWMVEEVWRRRMEVVLFMVFSFSLCLVCLFLLDWGLGLGLTLNVILYVND